LAGNGLNSITAANSASVKETRNQRWKTAKVRNKMNKERFRIIESLYQLRTGIKARPKETREKIGTDQAK